MMTRPAILDYVKAEPFRIHMASGRTFDIRHPEMIKVLKNDVLVFRATARNAEFFDGFDCLSLSLVESVSLHEVAVH